MLYFTDSGMFLLSSLGSQGLQSNPMLTTEIELYDKIIHSCNIRKYNGHY